MNNQALETYKQPDIKLRQITKDDLPAFFNMQQDKDANHMAAFTARDSTDREAFDLHWSKIMADDTVVKSSIIFEGKLVGCVLSWQQSGKREICYWIEKEQWGKGIATTALREFLSDMTERPLYAYAARDNVGSIRVLEKCGFVITGYQNTFASARRKEIEEAVMELRT
jgi:RimJ/RimL family protein N-acetyltransferase